MAGATQTLPRGISRKDLDDQDPVAPAAQRNANNANNNDTNDDNDDDDDDLLEHTQAFIPTSLTQAQIWGTEINVQHCVNAFSSFLEHFSADATTAAAAATDMSTYAQIFVNMYNEGSSVLNLDCGHLLRYAATRSLYEQLVR